MIRVSFLAALVAVIAASSAFAEDRQERNDLYCRESGVHPGTYSPARTSDHNWVDDAPASTFDECRMQIRNARRGLYCRQSASKTHFFGPAALDTGRWLDDSPAQSIESCEAQVGSSRNGIYCRASTQYPERFSPAYVKDGYWVDPSATSAPATDLRTCIRQVVGGRQ